MYRTAKKLALAVALLGLLQVTFVCDAEVLEDFFEDLGIEVYYDRHYDCDDCYHSGCWSNCDDDWSFDFDWWW